MHSSSLLITMFAKFITCTPCVTRNPLEQPSAKSSPHRLSVRRISLRAPICGMNLAFTHKATALCCRMATSTPHRSKQERGHQKKADITKRKTTNVKRQGGAELAQIYSKLHV
eukprot:5558800-Amphidinium_carterae.1